MSEIQPGSGIYEDGAYRYAVRVYFEDTDAGGIVYYANYLRFAERARTEMLRLAGFDQSVLLRDVNDPIAFVVKRCVVDYIGMARLDDTLIIETRVMRVSGARLEMDQRILRAVDGIEVAHVTVMLACLSVARGKGARVPETIRRALAAYKVKEQV